MEFLYVLKMYHVKLFIVEKKWGLERLPNNARFIPNLSHYCKKIAFSILLKPKLRMQDCAYVRILWPIYTGFYPRMWAEGYFGLLFSKIDFCAFNIFHFNTPQVNLVSNWALN